MAENNVNLNSLVVLFEFLGFNIIFEPNSEGLPKLNDTEIHLVSKKYKIKLNHVQESPDDQREELNIPKFKDNTKNLIAEKLTSILDLISRPRSKNHSSEICALRRGSSINVSKSFTQNIANLETSDICTSPPIRCSSPVIARFGQTPSKRTNRKTVADLLMKARNLIDLAMDMCTKFNIDPLELGLNSTFTKNQTTEQSRMEGPRISNISKVSPLAEIKCDLGNAMDIDSVKPLLDVTNTDNVCHVPTPKKIFNAFDKLTARKKNDSIEKNWRRPFTKIGILKQPSKNTGSTSIRNSPIGRFKENHIDTPRPVGVNRSSSTNNLSSPYMRPSPRATTANTNNTPSPRYLRAQDSAKQAAGLRKPGWCTKK